MIAIYGKRMMPIRLFTSEEAALEWLRGFAKTLRPAAEQVRLSLSRRTVDRRGASRNRGRHVTLRQRTTRSRNPAKSCRRLGARADLPRRLRRAPARIVRRPTRGAAARIFACGGAGGPADAADAAGCRSARPTDPRRRKRRSRRRPAGAARRRFRKRCSTSACGRRNASSARRESRANPTSTRRTSRSRSPSSAFAIGSTPRRPKASTRSRAWVKSALDEGVPVLAGVKILPTEHPDWGLDHFVLVVGHGDDGLLVNTTWGTRQWVSDRTAPTKEKALSFKNAFYGIPPRRARAAGGRFAASAAVRRRRRGGGGEVARDLQRREDRSVVSRGTPPRSLGREPGVVVGGHDRRVRLRRDRAHRAGGPDFAV